MPNSRTFSIKPIEELIHKYAYGKIIDPFANSNKLATITNDLDTQYNTDYHMDALDFLKMFEDESVDTVLYVPPYSPRQVSECYKNLGQTVNMQTTQASYWSKQKQQIGRIVKSNGIVITCSWNSGGIGKKYGFEIEEILLVPHWYIGAVGFLASYNGRFFDGGYAGLVNTKAGTVRNYYDEAKRNLLEQIPKLQNIEFEHVDYAYYTDFEDCLFYLDPPYKGTKQYGSSKGFDYDRFWSWVEHLSEKNVVLISEHEAPSEFECIWQQEVKRTIDNNKRVKAVEKLFEIRE